MDDDTAVTRADVAKEIVAGLAMGALEISVATSFAFLIFAGQLDEALPRAVGLIIVGAGLNALLIARYSRIEGVIGGLQDAPAVVIAAVVAALVVDVDPEVAEATVFTFIVVVGVVLGVVFVVAGRFRLTTAARSLPFSVVSGFMAGTGWLIGKAGIEVMVDRSLTWGAAFDLLEWDVMRFWLPGLVFALVVVGGSRYDRRGLLYPFGIVALTGAVHIVGWIVSSLDGLRDEGWLLGPLPDTQGWEPVTPAELADADWGAIAGQTLPALGLVGVALLSIVLNIAGLELETNDEIAMEREVMTAGATTSAVSALSGLPGFHQLGGTIIARQLGSKSWIAPAVIFAMCAIVGFAGAGAVALLPRAVAGGVLLAVGISMIVGWVRQVRLQLNRLEGALSAAILGSIIAFGVLTGIGVGLLAAILGFVFSYSRVEPVRRLHRLGTSRSVVDRPRAHRLLIDEHRHDMLGVELVGYLFFGSIRKVTDLVTPILENGDLRFLVLDFRAVRGLDASVCSGLQTIQRRTVDAGAEVVWSGLTDEFATELRRGGAEITEHRFDDLDHALEYVEEQVIRRASSEDRHDELVPERGDLLLLELLEGRCERIELAPGENLLEAGDDCGEMYLVEQGTLTAWGVGDDGRRVRLRRVSVGSVVGEVAFVAGGVRTATVCADEPSTVLRLTSECFDGICESEPELGVRIQAELSKRLAERLTYTSAAYQRALRL